MPDNTVEQQKEKLKLAQQLLETQRQVLEQEKELVQTEEEKKQLSIEIQELDIEKLENEKKLLLLKTQEKVILDHTVKTAVKEAAQKSKEIKEKKEALLKDKKALEENKKLLEKQRDTYEETAKLAKEFLRDTMGISLELNRTEKFLTQGAKSLGEWSKNAKENKTQLLQLGVAGLSVLTSITQKILEPMTLGTLYFSKAFDDLSAGMAKVTGRGRELDGTLSKSAQGLKASGVTFAASGAAFGSLAESVTGFIDASEAQQVAAIQSAATLESLGVSAETSGQNYETFMKVLGYSYDEAIKLNSDLVLAASALGKPASALAKDFAAAAPQIAQYGKRAYDVFLELETQSRATGVAINEMLAFADRTDTFEGAAEAAGRLNQVLGGGLINTMELLAADAPAKIQMVTDAVQKSGRAWDDLGRFEQKAIASAAGMDLVTAAKQFSAEQQAIDRAKNSLEGFGDTNMTVAERAEKAQTTMKQWQAILESLAIVISPLVRGIHAVVTQFAVWTDSLSNWGKGGILIVTTLAFIGLAFAKAKLMSMLAAKGLAAAAQVAGNGFLGAARPIAAGIRMIGGAALQSAPGLGMIALLLASFALVLAGLGVAVAGIGYGFKFMAEAFWTVIASINNLKSEKLWEFIKGLYAIAPVAPFLIPTIWTLGLLAAGIALVGVSLRLAAGPMKMFSDSFNMLMNNLSFSKLSEAMFSLGMIAETLNDIPENKAVALSASLSGFDGLLTKIKSIPTESIKFAAELATAATQYDKATASKSSEGSTVALLNAIKNTQQATPVVNVYIGNKQFKDYVVETAWEPTKGFVSNT